MRIGEVYQFTSNDIVIEVVRKNIKTLRLKVCAPTGRVQVSTPLRVNEEFVRRFVASKIEWIKKHKAKFVSRTPQLALKYVTGERHDFQGQSYLLNVVYDKGFNKVVVRNDSTLDLYVHQYSQLIQRQRVMDKWYRQQIKEQINPLIEKWQSIIGVQITDCRIKKMKTRWGSCNIKARRIWLSLELIKKPPLCLEYVIVHELVHLLERRHNRRFVAYMNQFMPEWRIYKEQLNLFVPNPIHDD